jgi:hypothetical protein
MSFGYLEKSKKGLPRSEKQRNLTLRKINKSGMVGAKTGYDKN